MAGIAGIVVKHKNQESEKYNQAFKAMMDKLAYSDDQLYDTFSNDKCYLGNVIPVASKKNDHYIKATDLPYHIVVDGLAFVDAKEKEILNKQYYLVGNSEDDYFYLPYLFDYYKNEFVHHIRGWYNIFVYDENTRKSLLVNDRLGYLPLYYYSDKHVFIFSSKIESILSSGLMPEIEIDKVTMSEHLLFNYPLSDYTYIKNIYTLPDAVCINPGEDKVKPQKYWDVEEYFGHSPLPKKQSIQVIDEALKKSVKKFMNYTDKAINFSLTGGWDSRVVLSYLLPEYKDKIKTYSFGAPEADDITVPSYIAFQEGFEYSPYVLDNNYLGNQFIENARDTILLSNGTRNYKRTHYIYAIKQIGQNSEFLLTGIFGDEVFKVGRPKGGTVISQNAVDFIDLNFNAEKLLNQMELDETANLFEIKPEALHEMLRERLNEAGNRFKKYETMGEKYFAFRFALNLRKYFGNEVNSYNDFVYCFSPFIDHDFLKEFAKTRYMVSRFGFNVPSLKLKAQSSKLYYKITKLNYNALTKYHSTRGFTMKDTSTITGKLKIIKNKIIRKKKNIAFMNKYTRNIFYKMLYNKEIKGNLKKELSKIKKTTLNEDDYVSLEYWKAIVLKKEK